MIRCSLISFKSSRSFSDTLLNSIHSGLTAGSVKMDFGRLQKSTYKNHIVPAFGSFLKKCYSKLYFEFVYYFLTEIWQ